MEEPRNKRRRYEIEDVNELLERNIELASHIHVDPEKCVEPVILGWLRNYDHCTSGQPLSLYYALMTTIAHVRWKVLSCSGIRWHDMLMSTLSYSDTLVR